MNSHALRFKDDRLVRHSSEKFFEVPECGLETKDDQKILASGLRIKGVIVRDTVYSIHRLVFPDDVNGYGEKRGVMRGSE